MDTVQQLPTPANDIDIVKQGTILSDMDVVEDNSSILTAMLNTNSFYRSKHTRVNIQFKGNLVSFGYSERIYELCGSVF